MSKIAFFDDVGRITQVQNGANPGEIEGYRARGLNVLLVETGDVLVHSYVLDGVLTPRPVAPISIDKTEILADGEDSALITGLPIPCEIQIDGVPQVIDDDELHLVATMPATYSVRFDQWPFVPWSTVVTAV
jgi:hypothetical protein